MNIVVIFTKTGTENRLFMWPVHNQRFSYEDHQEPQTFPSYPCGKADSKSRDKGQGIWKDRVQKDHKIKRRQIRSYGRQWLKKAVACFVLSVLNNWNNIDINIILVYNYYNLVKLLYIKLRLVRRSLCGIALNIFERKSWIGWTIKR